MFQKKISFFWLSKKYWKSGKMFNSHGGEIIENIALPAVGGKKFCCFHVWMELEVNKEDGPTLLKFHYRYLDSWKWTVVVAGPLPASLTSACMPWLDLIRTLSSGWCWGYVVMMKAVAWASYSGWRHTSADQGLTSSVGMNVSYGGSAPHPPRDQHER